MKRAMMMVTILVRLNTMKNKRRKKRMIGKTRSVVL